MALFGPTNLITCPWPISRTLTEHSVFQFFSIFSITFFDSFASQHFNPLLSFLFSINSIFIQMVMSKLKTAAKKLFLQAKQFPRKMKRMMENIYAIQQRKKYLKVSCYFLGDFVNKVRMIYYTLLLIMQKSAVIVDDFIRVARRIAFDSIVLHFQHLPCRKNVPQLVLTFLVFVLFAPIFEKILHFSIIQVKEI